MKRTSDDMDNNAVPLTQENAPCKPINKPTTTIKKFSQEEMIERLTAILAHLDYTVQTCVSCGWMDCETEFAYCKHSACTNFYCMSCYDILHLNPEHERIWYCTECTDLFGAPEQINEVKDY